MPEFPLFVKNVGDANLVHEVEGIRYGDVYLGDLFL